MAEIEAVGTSNDSSISARDEGSSESYPSQDVTSSDHGDPLPSDSTDPTSQQNATEPEPPDDSGGDTGSDNTAIVSSGAASQSSGGGGWQSTYKAPYTVFGGDPANQGPFTSNPFAECASVKHPSMSSATGGPVTAPNEGLIAPSRFGARAFQAKFGASDSDTEDDKVVETSSCTQPAPSVLTPSRIAISSRADPVTGGASGTTFQLRPSSFSANFSCTATSSTENNASHKSSSLLKPARLPAPDSEAESSQPVTEDACNSRIPDVNSDSEVQSSSRVHAASSAVATSDEAQQLEADSTSVNSTDHAEALRQKRSRESHDDSWAQSSENSDSKRLRLDNGENGDGDAAAVSQEFVFGQNLADRVAGVSSTTTVNSINAMVSAAVAPVHATSTVKPPDAPTSSSNSGEFVFGQNLQERVIAAAETPPKELPDPDEPPTRTEPSRDEPVESTTIEHVSGDASKTEGPSLEGATACSPTNGEKSLADAAREYQAQHERRLELDEVEVKTGEEEESNVLQANVKLYVFEGDKQNWVERGRGTIRLNDLVTSDEDHFQSRLVMRTQGSLRLILNTKIWSGMTIEQAGPKSVRLTASDVDEGIKVFLIMANPKDTEHILGAIDWRIQRLKIIEDRNEGSGRVTEKRKHDDDELDSTKKARPDACLAPPCDVKSSSHREESNDSSVADPETEASCESHSSSLTAKSESE